MFGIGELSRRTCVGVETIRYYERVGVLPEPMRKKSGYRTYDGTAEKRLRFIKEAQSLGFSLREISDLLQLSENHDTECKEVHAKALEKVEDITVKITRLMTMKESLEILAGLCPADSQPVENCGILNRLYGAYEQGAAS